MHFSYEGPNSVVQHAMEATIDLRVYSRLKSLVSTANIYDNAFVTCFCTILLASLMMIQSKRYLFVVTVSDVQSDIVQLAFMLWSRFRVIQFQVINNDTAC